MWRRSQTRINTYIHTLLEEKQTDLKRTARSANGEDWLSGWAFYWLAGWLAGGARKLDNAAAITVAADYAGFCRGCVAEADEHERQWLKEVMRRLPPNYK